MKVLLINPPREVPQQADFPPLGLAYICASLQKNGFTANVIDAVSFSWKKLKEIIHEKKPDIIGIPCWTFERGQSFKLAALAKEIFPKSKIIMGGHHATAFPEHLLKLPYIDAIVLGEGEITMVELLKTFQNNEDLKTVKGIAYKKDDEIIITEPRELISDLDSIPFPSYNDFKLKNYLGLPEVENRAVAMITSRGCPYQCAFCSGSKFWQRRWRARTAENVLREIKWLTKDYGVNAFMFFDDNFTVKKDRAIEICQKIIEENLQIKWVACSHVSHIDEELLSWMKRAGCYRIDYGVESGSLKILNNIHKSQTVQQIERAFELTHKADIKPRAYLMVGNPGEDEKTIEETVQLLKKIKPHNAPSGQILCILPDTEIYELAKSKGIISDDFWLGETATMYYTGDHDVEKLKKLRNQLMGGIAKNQKNIKSYIEFMIRKMYYRYPFLQKGRRWRRIIKI